MMVEHLCGQALREVQERLEKETRARMALEVQIDRQAKEIARLQAIVDCCAELVPPDDSLEVNKRVAVELERLQEQRDSLYETHYGVKYEERFSEARIRKAAEAAEVE